jgi:hypothetical protein
MPWIDFWTILAQVALTLILLALPTYLFLGVILVPIKRLLRPSRDTTMIYRGDSHDD